MKYSNCVFCTFMLLASEALSGVVSGGLPAADGILVMQPATDANTAAVRLEIPPDQMLVGVRWYNGSDSRPFSRVLVASGSGLFPPSIAEAMEVAEDVSGVQNDWSAIELSQPVASQTGTLFVAFEYQSNYAPIAGEPTHGVGYLFQEGDGCYFVSGDGAKWFKIASSCRLLIVPILEGRDASAVALSEAHVEIEPDVVPFVPASLSLKAYPNPFNPEVALELGLPLAGPVDVRIYDIGGRQVRRLHAGGEQAGILTLTWDGRDNGGRRLSSGVYWAQANTASGMLTRRMVMIK